jgi:formiminotetrahydrofolate cyclodeaminase
MGAALGTMVSRLAKLDAAAFEDDRAFFTAAVERDAAAFEKVMAAYKRPKDERAPFVEEALRGAALVPLEVLERAASMGARLEKLEVPERFASDLVVAKALTTAARAGALENVRINLDCIENAAFQAAVEARLRGLTAAAQ